MTEIVPQYYSFKIKLVVSDSILCVFVSIYNITNKYRGFLRSSDGFFHTSYSFRTIFTFFLKLSFELRSALVNIQITLVLREKANYEINCKRIKTVNFFVTLHEAARLKIKNSERFH